MSGLISRGADMIYTYRFLRLLTQPWTSTQAFDLGIIDKNGKPLKKVRDLSTAEEKRAYTMFHRLVFRIKRSAARLPFGNFAVNSFAAAHLLLRDSYNVDLSKIDDTGVSLISESYDEISELEEGNIYSLIEGCLTLEFDEYTSPGTDIKVLGNFEERSDIYVVESLEDRELLLVTISEVTSTAGATVGATPHVRKFVLPMRDFNSFNSLMKRNKLDKKLVPSITDQLVVECETTGRVKYVKVYD